ncbi:MAG: alanine/glycine:cation symporter family protein [Actinomycetaceae bacterium]|nr:alanine/glycine:cation symporter family protein [Actinomycetaceae bacterium]
MSVTTVPHLVATEAASSAFERANDWLAGVLDATYGWTVVWVLIVMLIGVGLYFTIRLRAVQLRLFAHMVRSVSHSRKDAVGGISSFQAFAIGLADRVGTGTMAGVAIAIVSGGPGAVFWMWVVALVGMATAFVESTLAQIFKVRNADGTFRGGPAFYLERGLKSRRWGAVFAVLLIFAYGFSFQMIQANTLAQVAEDSFHVAPWVTAIILVLLTAPFIVGGVKPVARLAEYLAPIMALAYLAMAVAIVALNADKLGAVFSSIFSEAFGWRQVGGGSAAGFIAALEQGVKRGLFTNEAGMGSAPNAAATATVSHPVKQGLIQSLGVFVDTMIVCTATAFIILVGGIYVDGKAPEGINGAVLTAQSLGQLGSWTQAVTFIILAAFAYSTLLGNYTYAESNIKYLRGIDNKAWFIKGLTIFSIALGSVLTLKAAWAIADWGTALMTLVNLVAIVLLGRWVIGALADYEEQRRTRHERDIVFIATANRHLPGELPGDVWAEDPRRDEPSSTISPN